MVFDARAPLAGMWFGEGGRLTWVAWIYTRLQ